MRRALILLLIPMLLASCHQMDTSCKLGTPRWIKPTKAERTAHLVPAEDRAQFEMVARHSVHNGKPDRLIGEIQEGDLIAYHMTSRQKRDGVLDGDVRTILYLVVKYAHLAIVVRDPDEPDKLRLYSSETSHGPNLLEGLSDLEKHSFDVYRLDKIDRLDMNRLREFAAVSVEKKDKCYGYSFLSMFGIWSDKLEPETKEDIDDDYMCSTSVAAALHYAGFDLDRVRCCEAFSLISPSYVLNSGGRIYQPGAYRSSKQ